MDFGPFSLVTKRTCGPKVISVALPVTVIP